MFWREDGTQNIVLPISPMVHPMGRVGKFGRTPCGIVGIGTSSSISLGHYGTFLGGSGADFATSIAADAQGNSYIAGETASTDFPGLPERRNSLANRLMRLSITRCC